MGKKVLIPLVTIVALISLVLVSCGTPAAPAPTPAPAPAPQGVKRVNISVGSSTGSTTLAGSAVAGVLKRYLGIEPTVLNYPTVLREAAVGRGETQLAVGMWMYGDRIYAGNLDQAKGEKYPELREVMPAWPMWMQVLVPVDSPVKTFRDLVGKTISPGTKAFSSWQILSDAMPSLGIDYEKDLKPQYMGHAEAAAALVAGKIDAYFYTGLFPFGTFAKTDLTRPLRLIGFTQEDAEKVAKATPGLGVGTIKPTAYHMDKAVTTVSSVNMVLTRKDFPENTVYDLVKNMIENSTYVGYFQKDMQDFIEDENGARAFVEMWPASIVPFHKGAVRYYQQIGWKVPAQRMPSD